MTLIFITLLTSSCINVQNSKKGEISEEYQLYHWKSKMKRIQLFVNNRYIFTYAKKQLFTKLSFVSAKSVVKILSPSQGKSLIIPTSNPQIIKHIQEQRSTPTKQINQVVTQQLLQTIAAQQKQILVQKQANESADGSQEKIKVSIDTYFCNDCRCTIFFFLSFYNS